MSSFALTNQAKQDLKNIARYTQEHWGREQRNHYLKTFDETFGLLASKPLLGRDCSHLGQSYQKFPVGSHIIFYKQSSSSLILIVRILHKRMDDSIVLTR